MEMMLVLAVALQGDPSAGVGLDARLNEPVPMGAVFTNDVGRVVRLEECLDGKPTLLVLVYYRCPMLCGEVLDGLVRSLRALPLRPGRDFNVVAVSIDPREPWDLAYLKKEAVVRRYGRAGSEGGWHFLVGGEGSIRTLAQAVGFRYRYDERTRQYAHAGGVMVITPEGRVARYFYGIDYPPRDVRLGLVEAAQGKIAASAGDRVLLLCFRYDPATGRYSLAIWQAVRLGGIVTLAVLGGLVFFLRRRGRDSRFVIRNSSHVV